MKPLLATLTAIFSAGILLAAPVSSAEQFEKAVQDSARRAMILYPDCMAPGTPLFRAVDDQRLRMEQTDPAFFRNSDWARTLTAQEAARLGIAPATDPAAGAMPGAAANSASLAPSVTMPAPDSGFSFPPRAVASA